MFLSARVFQLILVVVNVFLGHVYSRSVSDEGNFEVSLIHINDFHARFEQTSETSGTCVEGEEDTCVGGIARISTVVKDLVNSRPNAIFLNAGDNFQGTIWYTKFKWNVTAYFLNMLPHDALTLGNHEFDDGVDGVVPFLENVNAPFVAANIDATHEPTMLGKYKKSIIIERNGKKIGIIGYVMQSYPELSSTGKLKFLNEIETVKEEAANLKSQGVDIIFALSHAGLDVDREVAEAVPDLDVIVGGHSHSFLYTGTPPSTETPVDNYPVIIEQSGGRKVLVVQAYAYSKYVGNVTIWFDEKGEFVEWEGSPILLDKTIEQDLEVVEELKVWKEIIDAEANRVVGSTKVFLDANDRICAKGECNIGKLIADAYVHEFLDSAPEGSWTQAAIGIVNSGGIRASIEETRPGGNITYEDLLGTTPFSNTVDILELQGKHVLEMLEFSVSRSYAHERGNGKHKREIEKRKFDGQGFLQFSGMKVKFDLTQPVMNRVMNVSIRCAECRIPVYEDLDLEKWYHIATISFLVNGGDGYNVIRDNAQNHTAGRLDSDVLLDYIGRISPITVGIEGNVEFVEPQEKQQPGSSNKNVRNVMLILLASVGAVVA